MHVTLPLQPGYELFDGVFILDPYPALYIKDVRAVCVSDVHLHYEDALVSQGIFIPKLHIKEVTRRLKNLTRMVEGTRKFVINGDLVEPFDPRSVGRSINRESKEISEIMDIIKEKFTEVIVVKGNHDTFISSLSRAYSIKVYDEYYINGYGFIHGHELPSKVPDDIHTLFIGHEHPSIALYDEIGIKEKVFCFLYGKTRNGIRIVVIPPFSTFHAGTEINIVPKEELLSPVLRDLVDVDELNVVAISEETGCLKFPKLGMLRRLTSI